MQNRNEDVNYRQSDVGDLRMTKLGERLKTGEPRVGDNNFWRGSLAHRNNNHEAAQDKTRVVVNVKNPGRRNEIGRSCDRFLLPKDTKRNRD